MQNHWGNFNQTLHKAQLDRGQCPYPSGDNSQNVKVY